MMSGYRSQSSTQTCECGNAKVRARDESCARCAELERSRKQAESPTRALLSVLQRWDGWISNVEMAAAIGVSTSDVSDRLGYLRRRGQIESRWEKGGGAVYRLKQRRAA